MRGKQSWWITFLLVATLLLTGCSGSNADTIAAEAEYIRAKAHVIDTEAGINEERIATLRQQRDQMRADAELGLELKRERHQVFVEIAPILLVGGLSAVTLVACLHMLRNLAGTWTDHQVRLLRERVQEHIRIEQDKAKKQRHLLECQARFEEKRQKTLQLEIQLAQMQTSPMQEQQRPKPVPTVYGGAMERKVVGGNGQKH